MFKIRFILLFLKKKMIVFNSLKIDFIKRLTTSSIIIGFEVPIGLLKDYQFISGQYITLEAVISNQKARRSYSVCVDSAMGKLRIAVKELKNGLFSSYLNKKIKIGDFLKVSTPEGRFLYKPSVQKQNFVSFAAGSGITPILSILKSSLSSKTNHHFTLIYGNKTLADTMFYLELKNLEKKFSKQLLIYWVFSREEIVDSFFGRIDLSLLNFLFKKIQDFNNLYYICGPSKMSETLKNFLEGKKVPLDKINAELFSPDEKQNNVPTIESKKSISLSIFCDEIIHDLTITDSQTILDAALENNIDVPYSCQGGVCSSCIARLKKGTVKMLKNEILTDEDVSEGLILTCQSISTSNKIVVDYDGV